MKKQAFLFGYGLKGRSLAKGLKEEQFRLKIIEADVLLQQKAIDEGYLDVKLMDVTQDSALERLEIDEESYIICVMEDEHLNVFLTLSLRSLFPNTTIVAISDSIYTTQKLNMAGATKVIDLYQVSANRIHNILRRPVATKLLDSFVSDACEISFREMTITEASPLDGKMIEDIDFAKEGVLLLGMIDVELSHKFIFITSGINHKLDAGDTIVCMGYNQDLDYFEKKMKLEYTL
ncbi:MAG: TrkA family potassium uptake protein [Deltaproteobacteria bacterium]|nr:TrkA family potassium uptake protein [Deltaproteobacteria bacterium]